MCDVAMWCRGRLLERWNICISSQSTSGIQQQGEHRKWEEFGCGQKGSSPGCGLKRADKFVGGCGKGGG